MHVGDSDSAQRAVMRHQGREQYEGYFYLFGLIIACAAIGSMIMPSERGPGMAIGVVVAFIGYAFISEALQRRALRRYRRRADLPDETTFRVEVSPAGLRYDLGDVQHTAKWSAVTELASRGGFWIFFIRSSPWVLPRRSFTDETSEKEFVKSALGYMTATARQRSANAEAFVS